MKKTYYNPEVDIVEFQLIDKTSLNALSAGGTNTTVTNQLRNVSLSRLNK